MSFARPARRSLPRSCEGVSRRGNAWRVGGRRSRAGADGGGRTARLQLCARCQAIVGAAARSAPVIAPVPNAALAPLFLAMGLAPLTAAAAAMTLWMVVPDSDTMQRAAAPAPATAAPARIAPEAAKREPPAPAIPRRNRRRQELADAAASAAPRPRAPRNSREANRQRANSRTARASGSCSAPRGTHERTLGAAAASPRRPPHRLPRPRRADKSAKRLASRRSRSCHPIASRRWRVVNGAIERSEDGGASWIATRTLSGRDHHRRHGADGIDLLADRIERTGDGHGRRHHLRARCRCRSASTSPPSPHRRAHRHVTTADGAPLPDRRLRPHLAPES